MENGKDKYLTERHSYTQYEESKMREFYKSYSGKFVWVDMQEQLFVPYFELFPINWFRQPLNTVERLCYTLPKAYAITGKNT